LEAYREAYREVEGDHLVVKVVQKVHPVSEVAHLDVEVHPFQAEVLASWVVEVVVLSFEVVVRELQAVQNVDQVADLPFFLQVVRQHQVVRQVVHRAYAVASLAWWVASFRAEEQAASFPLEASYRPSYQQVEASYRAVASCPSCWEPLVQTSPTFQLL